jgi:hypothetical protein
VDPDTWAPILAVALVSLELLGLWLGWKCIIKPMFERDESEEEGWDTE